MHPLRTFLVVLSLATVGCRCRPDVDMVDSRFRVAAETQRLDFGRVLEGTTAERSVRVIAETRAAVSIGLSTRTPFSVEPLLELGGGDELEVPVTFKAGNGEATGELVLTSGRQEVRVALVGFGVRPPSCVPSAACRQSSYSLEEDRCLERLSPDETPCDPDSQCLEQGRCRMGQCLGVARRCNDNDACTSDACAMDAGCVHTRIACPAPTALCRVPTCDPRTGCGEATAPDGTPCGPTNCVTARVCALGACIEVPTPEGTDCGPAIACYGPSKCVNQRCQRPDAGDYRPTWSARIDGLPEREVPVLLGGPGGTLFFPVCGLTPLPPDGGPDAGLADGGRDGGIDGGADGGTDGDAGALDAGPATECALLSYTSTGFDRFSARATEVERLGFVGPEVVLRLDGGLVFRSRSTGAFLGGWATGTLLPSQLAMLSDGGAVVAMRVDGGSELLIAGTASTTPLARLAGAVSHVAIGPDERLWALTAERVFTLVSDLDGGLVVWSTPIDAGTALLASGSSFAVAGSQLVRFFDDGGARVTGLESPFDAGLLPRDVLVSPSAVHLFFRGCRAPFMSCLPEDETTWLRAYDPQSGSLQWEDAILPEGLRARVVESVALTFDRAVAAVVEQEFDGGAVLNGLVVDVDGGRALECPFPAGTGRLAASLFRPGQLLTLALRPDGGVMLESWPLGVLPVETRGWPAAEGVSGQRRAVP